MRVTLVHWNEPEARERAARLRAAGFTVDGIVHGALGPASFKAMWSSPPDACVIDLSRLPSHGRDVALGLRERKSTRGVPIVFLEGEREKVARIRSVLPDALYGTWATAAKLVARAIAHPPAAVPRKRFDAYSGTPLPEKLGIKPGSRVALIGAPRDFATTLGKIPDGASIGSRDAALALWFVRSAKELKAGIARRAKEIPPAGLWICWPKKTSGVATDLSEPVVRTTGLAAGLVDFKICSVDATWSGLKSRRADVELQSRAPRPAILRRAGPGGPMRTLLAFVAMAGAAAAQDGKKPKPPTLEETLAWLQKLPAIKGQPADRFSKLTVDDLKELTAIKLGGHREPDGKHQQIPGADFRYLTSLPKLEDCDLAEIDGLDDVALAHLGDIPTLKKLEMGDAQITSAGLKPLTRLKELAHLGLGWATNLDDASVAHLLRMPKLESLNLSGTKVTDAALPHLAKLALKELRLNGTAVGDRGIASLAGMKSLEKLEVKKTKVTARGAAALQKARPDLAVTTK